MQYPASGSGSSPASRPSPTSSTPLSRALHAQTSREHVGPWVVSNHIEFICLRESSDSADPFVSATAIKVTPKPGSCVHRRRWWRNSSRWLLNCLCRAHLDWSHGFFLYTTFSLRAVPLQRRQSASNQAADGRALILTWRCGASGSIRSLFHDPWHVCQRECRFQLGWCSDPLLPYAPLQHEHYHRQIDDCCESEHTIQTLLNVAAYHFQILQIIYDKFQHLLLLLLLQNFEIILCSCWTSTSIVDTWIMTS